MIVLARKKRTAQYRCVEPARTRSLFCRSALTPVLPLAEFTGSSTLQKQRCQSSGVPSALRRTTSPTSSSVCRFATSLRGTPLASSSPHPNPLVSQLVCAGRRRCERPVRCFPGQLQQCLPASSSHRSSSPRADDGIGPSVDEFFTLSLGGMVTVSAPAYRPAPPRASDCAPRAHRHALSDVQLLNTSSASIFAGDLVEWSLSYEKAAMSNAKRARHGPRRIGEQTPPRTLQLAARVLTLVLFDVRYPDGDRFFAKDNRPCLVLRETVNCRL